tara:strand:+ start:5751 stop:6476 length:726 start_codon:yes stop_codon:yes gene_type:complete
VEIQTHHFKEYKLKSYYKQSVFNYLLKEIFEEEIYRFSTKSTTPIILDIGANVGLTCLYFKELFPNSNVIAYEPDSNSFECLKLNLNGLEVQLHQAAISNIKGDKKLYTASTVNNNLPIASLYKNEYSSLEVEVNVVNITSVVSQFDFIDFCKIDVEGEESNIVEGLVKSKLLKIVNEFVIEYHFWIKQKYSFEELIATFIANDYKFKLVSEKEVEGYSCSKTALLKFTSNNSNETKVTRI